MAANALRVLVLGGNGFLGRHVVQALTTHGHCAIVGSRQRAHATSRHVQLERMTVADDWPAVLADADVVVNCVGILRERGRETYARIHHLAPAALAVACAASGRRLVHVSALGLHASARSRFILSKLRGEDAIRAARGASTIVRPSLLDGEGGFGARWLRVLARLPVHCVPRDASGRIAMVDVRDVADAIVHLCANASEKAREVELGGTEAITLAQQLAVLRARRSTRPARLVTVPPWLARVVSHACDLTHLSPFSFGHLELLRHDNLPRHNALPALLGRAPRSMRAAAPRATPPAAVESPARAARPGAQGRA